MKNYIIVGLERLIIVIFKILSLILLMKFLSVNEMGVIAILSLFLGLSTLLMDSGFSGAFLRKNELINNDYNFLYSNSILISIVVYFFTTIISFYLEYYKNIDNIMIYSMIMMFCVFLKSKPNAYNLLFLKEKKYKKMALISNFSQISGFFVLVFLLLSGFEIYSFVFQVLFESVVVFFLYSRINLINFNYNFNYKLYGGELRIAYSTLLSSLIRSSFDYFLVFVILNIFGISKLGIYSQANKINNLFTTTFMGVVDKVTYINYVALNNDKLTEKFNKIFFYSLSISILFLFLMFFFIKIYVENFLNNDWLLMVDILPYFLMSAILVIADLNIRTLIKAKFSASKILKNEIYKKAIGFLSLLYFIYLGVSFNFIMKFLVVFYFISFLISFISVIFYFKSKIGFILNFIYVFLLFSMFGWAYV